MKDILRMMCTSLLGNNPTFHFLSQKRLLSKAVFFLLIFDSFTFILSIFAIECKQHKDIDLSMKIEDEVKQKQFRNEYHKAIINLFFTNNWVSAQIKDMLKPHQVTLQQYNVLRILNGQSPNEISIQDIKARMLDRMPDVSRIVERLRKQELINKITSSADKRTIKISISQKGKDLLESLKQYQEKMDQLVQKLSIEEATELNRLFDKIRSE